MPIPTEFTPEITQDFYDRLAKGIKDQGAQDVGNARSEALARGLQGDPFEANAVGAARSGTDSRLADLNANLNYQVAGLGREERLRNQSREWQTSDRDFAAGEADKDRAFRERLARLGYDQERDMESLKNRRGYQSALWNAGARLGASAIGGMF